MLKNILQLIVLGACATALIGCVTSSQPEAEYQKNYVLKTTTIVYDCWQFPDTWSTLFGQKQVRCLNVSLQDPPPGQRIEKGTEVQIVSIESHHNVDSHYLSATLHINTGSAGIDVYAEWPRALEILEELQKK